MQTWATNGPHPAGLLTLSVAPVRHISPTDVALAGADQACSGQAWPVPRSSLGATRALQSLGGGRVGTGSLVTVVPLRLVGRCLTGAKEMQPQVLDERGSPPDLNTNVAHDPASDKAAPDLMEALSTRAARSSSAGHFAHQMMQAAAAACADSLVLVLPPSARASAHRSYKRQLLREYEAAYRKLKEAWANSEDDES